MQPKSLSFRLARFSAIIIFVVSIMLLATNFIITVVPRKAEVRNSEGIVIGSVRLPESTEEFGMIFLAFSVFSGLQIWTLSLIGKEK
jgi:hypothetical protein